MRMFYINQLLQRYDSLRANYKEKLEEIEECKNRSKPDNDARVRPDAKTEFNRTVKRCSTGH
jgi:hypothetical protein